LVVASGEDADAGYTVNLTWRRSLYK
jgi:hypothetical protein